jgi:hypothetical protein
MAYGRFENIPAEVYRRVLETNLFGQIHGSRGPRAVQGAGRRGRPRQHVLGMGQAHLPARQRLRHEQVRHQGVLGMPQAGARWRREHRPGHHPAPARGHARVPSGRQLLRARRQGGAADLGRGGAGGQDPALRERPPAGRSPRDGPGRLSSSSTRSRRASTAGRCPTCSSAWSSPPSRSRRDLATCSSPSPSTTASPTDGARRTPRCGGPP